MVLSELPTRMDTLQSLAQKLQSYKPQNPPCLRDKDEEQEKRSLGFKPIPKRTHSCHVARAKERRAAVLVCLFEGKEGELRVILTKRSNNLATHSGMDSPFHLLLVLSK